MSRATRKPEAEARSARGRGNVGRGRRAVALALAVVLVFESMFSSGVPAAFADAITDGAGQTDVSAQLLEPSEDVAQISTPTTESGAPEGDESGTSTEEVVTPTEEGAEEKSADSTEKTEEPDEKNEASQPSTDPEQTPTTDQSGDSETVPETEPEQAPADPRDWTGRTESLRLSSPNGLTFAEDASPAEDGSLAATLDLAIELDATLDEDLPTLIAGDTIRVPLPEGITLALDEPLDVYQLNDEGEPTDLLVARAEVADDGATLKLTVVDSEEVATLAEVSLRLSLPVKVAGDLLGEEPGELEWILQTDAEDPAVTQTATLQLPAVPADEEAEKDNEAPAEPVVVDEETEARVEAVSQQVTATLADLMPELSYTYTELSGSAQMKITWCDNNSSNRPDMAGYAENVIPQFLLDGDTTWIDLVDENGNLTEEARQKLHIGEGQTPNWVKGTSAAAQSIGTWNVSVQGMPTKFVETITTPQLDEDGNQMFDEHGNALFEDKRHETAIAWRLDDTNKRPQNYTYGENDEGANGDQRYLMLTQQYTFTIQGKLGDKTLKVIFGDNLGTDAYAEHFRFSALIDNKQVVDGTGNVRSTTLEEMIEAQLGEG